MSSQESIYMLLRYCAIFIILVPTTLCAIDLFIRYMLQQDEEIMYRKWRIFSKIITIPAFVFAIAVFVVAIRCMTILSAPERVFDPAVLAVYGVKEGTLIAFVVFWAILLLASIVAAVFGWRYGDEYSDMEYSAWFLRISTPVEILDEEQKIKISWAFTYALLPKAVVLYIIAILFAIAPQFFAQLTTNVINDAVPPQLDELSTKHAQIFYADIDDNGICYIHWKKYDKELFDSHPELSNLYEIRLQRDINGRGEESRHYTFNLDGKLVSVEDHGYTKGLKKEIGNYALLDEFGFFRYPITKLQGGRVQYMVTPPIKHKDYYYLTVPFTSQN